MVISPSVYYGLFISGFRFQYFQYFEKKKILNQRYFYTISGELIHNIHLTKTVNIYNHTMLCRLSSKHALRVNSIKTRQFHCSAQYLYSQDNSIKKGASKPDLKDIKDWDDLMKLDSFDGIPTKQLEEIMKRKAVKMQYNMNPDKPLKTESELELEYVKELKKAEEAQRNQQWTDFKNKYKWSFVNWVVCIFIGYYMAKAASLEINYHINEDIYKERLNKKVQEFEDFKKSHIVEIASEEEASKPSRRKWFGLW